METVLTSKKYFFENFLNAAFSNGLHSFSSDTIKLMLTNSQPFASMKDSSEISEISTAGYTAGGYTCSLRISSQQDGTYSFSLDDVDIIALNGAIGPARYFVLYNDSAESNDLICCWDATQEFTLAVGEQVTMDFSEKIIEIKLG